VGQTVSRQTLGLHKHCCMSALHSYLKSNLFEGELFVSVQLTCGYPNEPEQTKKAYFSLRACGIALYFPLYIIHILTDHHTWSQDKGPYHSLLLILRSCTLQLVIRGRVLTVRGLGGSGWTQEGLYNNFRTTYNNLGT